MPTPPRVRNGILPPGPNGGVHQPVLLINRYDYDDGEPWGMDSDPEDEAAEDSDHGPRVWDTNNCDYGSGNFSSD
jgi:hypothetical protein